MTAGRLSARGTYGRMSHALTASPPKDAVGIVTLNASPASPADISTRKATRFLRNANRHPSASRITITTCGNTMISGRYQESLANIDAAAAGPMRMSTASNSAAPRMNNAARTLRISLDPHGPLGPLRSPLLGAVIWQRKSCVTGARGLKVAFQFLTGT